MQKKIVVGFILLFLNILNVTWADTPGDEPLHIGLGIKAWYLAFDNRSVVDVTFDSAVGIGPIVHFRYHDFFFEASYLSNLGKYKSDLQGSAEELVPFLQDYRYDMNVAVSKHDLDISAGYFFNEQLSMFAEYRHARMDYAADFLFFDPNPMNNSTQGTLPFNIDGSLTGFLLGVSGHLPTRLPGLICFGVVSQAFLTYHLNVDDLILQLGDMSISFVPINDVKEDVSGPSIECGLRYSLKKIPLSVSLGYIYQAYDGDNVSVDFKGVTIGVNYKI